MVDVKAPRGPGYLHRVVFYGLVMPVLNIAVILVRHPEKAGLILSLVPLGAAGGALLFYSGARLVQRRHGRFEWLAIPVETAKVVTIAAMLWPLLPGESILLESPTQGAVIGFWILYAGTELRRKQDLGDS